jgi:predicted Rdx family selenoprotein
MSESTREDAVNPSDGRRVEISINNAKYEVRPGDHSVADLKKIGGVPAADVLDQLVDGKLVPLPDDGHVVIHGGEQFFSHPRTGSSS